MCKINVYIIFFIYWFPNIFNQLALANAISRNKSCFYICPVHQLCSLKVPACYIIKLARSAIILTIFLIDFHNIFFLLFCLHRGTYKRRIAHYIIQFAFINNNFDEGTDFRGYGCYRSNAPCNLCNIYCPLYYNSKSSVKANNAWFV